MAAIKKSISLQTELFQWAKERQQDFGYSTFSDYLQALIKADMLKDTHIIGSFKEAPHSYGLKRKKKR